MFFHISFKTLHPKSLFCICICIRHVVILEVFGLVSNYPICDHVHLYILHVFTLIKSVIKGLIRNIQLNGSHLLVFFFPFFTVCQKECGICQEIFSQLPAPCLQENPSCTSACFWRRASFSFLFLSPCFSQSWW